MFRRSLIFVGFAFGLIASACGGDGKEGGSASSSAKNGATGAEGGVNGTANGSATGGDSGATGNANGSSTNGASGCDNDFDCKGDRICEGGTCVDPSPAGNGGSSGGANGSSAGDGGVAPGDGGAGGNGTEQPTSVDEVVCGEAVCDTTSESCCHAPPLLPGSTPTYSCESQCSLNQITMACDGDADCSDGQTCCRVEPGTLLILPLPGEPAYVCADSCDGRPIGCGGPEGCAAGEVCCGTVMQSGLPPLTSSNITKTACADSCDDGVVLCRTDDDCAGPDGGTGTCVPSQSLEGLSICSD